MDLEKRLNAVGKAVFVKYYYIFANMDNADCIAMITENFTEKSKRSRTSHAKAIFREEKQFDALNMICDSPRVDKKIKKKADRILFMYKKKLHYGFL